MYNAIVSVTDKTGLNRLIPFLWNRNFNIFSRAEHIIILKI